MINEKTNNTRLFVSGTELMDPQVITDAIEAHDNQTREIVKDASDAAKAAFKQHVNINDTNFSDKGTSLSRDWGNYIHKIVGNKVNSTIKKLPNPNEKITKNNYEYQPSVTHVVTSKGFGYYLKQDTSWNGKTSRQKYYLRPAEYWANLLPEHVQLVSNKAKRNVLEELLNFRNQVHALFPEFKDTGYDSETEKEVVIPFNGKQLSAAYVSIPDAAATGYSRDKKCYLYNGITEKKWTKLRVSFKKTFSGTVIPKIEDIFRMTTEFNCPPAQSTKRTRTSVKIALSEKLGRVEMDLDDGSFSTDTLESGFSGGYGDSGIDTLINWDELINHPSITGHIRNFTDKLKVVSKSWKFLKNKHAHLLIMNGHF